MASRFIVKLDKNMENRYSITFRKHRDVKKRKLVNFDYQNVNSLCSLHHCVNSLCQFCVFIEFQLRMNLLPFYHESHALIGYATHVKYSMIDSEQRSIVRWGPLLCVYEASVKRIQDLNESLGELEKAVEALACGSCSHNISRSPKLPLVFLQVDNTPNRFSIS